ncbi:MAG: nitroreductase family protein [Deltaproteobacteria bacterium]|nr:nitroreductase family protein [Deltaproteobacteria bacterium]
MKRRSIRKFTDREVTEEQVKQILQAALLSPSAHGRQSWEFIVVRDKNMLQHFGNCRQPKQPFLPETPVAIAVLGNPEVIDVWVEDGSIAMTHMMLEATALGLGSCWVQIRNRPSNQNDMPAADYIKQLLHVPEPYQVLAILALGYPGQEKEPLSLEQLPYHKIHRERF